MEELNVNMLMLADLLMVIKYLMLGTPPNKCVKFIDLS